MHVAQSQIADFVHEALTGSCMGAPCRDTYNEVVVLKQAYESQLPHSIAAVFCVRDATCAEARGVHTRFLAAYGLTSEQVPLLQYRFGEGFVDV